MTGSVSNRDRLLALASIVLMGLVVITVVLAAAHSIAALATALVGLAVTAAGAWWVITEQLPRRALGVLGILVGMAVLAGAARIALNDSEDGRLWPWLLAVALAIGAGVCSRVALRATLHTIDLSRFPKFRPKRPVLICNPLSGGGKVEGFDLVAKAQRLGVEVILLDRGRDLEQLARDAVARGADCLAMAGGDGSQALVASIAVEHGLPFACISAGTRNHFALDLGLERADPSKGLDAFTNGVLRRVDYALAGDRPFVNNVSLGVYAEIVQSDAYRGAKLATATHALPDLLGSDAEPIDLQFTAPDGETVDGALVILVSNNPYTIGLSLDAFQRRSLTTGALGVFAVNASSGREAAELVARAAAGLSSRDPRLHHFTAQEFEVRSRSGSAEAGVDGEALTLATPMKFRIVPRGLTLLVPADNPGVSAMKHYRSLGVGGLWEIARGRVPHGVEEVI